MKYFKALFRQSPRRNSRSLKEKAGGKSPKQQNEGLRRNIIDKPSPIKITTLRHMQDFGNIKAKTKENQVLESLFLQRIPLSG